MGVTQYVLGNTAIGKSAGRLRDFGLMWAYRFAQEPRRMWKRYLIGNPRFVWILAKERLRGTPKNGAARPHETA